MSALRFWRNHEDVWTLVEGAPTFSMVNGNHCATLSGIQSLSDWSLAAGTPTAVELQHLDAHPSPVMSPWVIFGAILGGLAAGAVVFRKTTHDPTFVR